MALSKRIFYANNAMAMTFSLHHEGGGGGGSHVKSVHALGTCALPSVVSPFLQFTQPHHVTAPNPSPGNKPPERGQKNTRTK